MRGLVRVVLSLESRLHVNDSGMLDPAPHWTGCKTVQASWQTGISGPRAVSLNPAHTISSACHVPAIDFRLQAGKGVFWRARLRSQGHLDLPGMD